MLYLAWRRQRSTEDTLAHQERVAESTERDAVERRITDLYTKGADQLGSDKAPVRLAGLYALERLAQNNPTQRQTIVNLLCAYLRMPFDPPVEPFTLLTNSGRAPDTVEAEVGHVDESTTRPVDSDRDDKRRGELLAEHRERVQEQEVRLTVQRILVARSQPGSEDVEKLVDTYWPGLDLDLTGDAEFGEEANFSGAEFEGEVEFGRANLGRYFRFEGADFENDVSLELVALLRAGGGRQSQEQAEASDTGGVQHDT